VKFEVGFSGPGDAPAAVVQFHVVETAEQDPAVDVSSAAVAVPFVDVMRLTVRGRSVASGPTAAAVAQGETDALRGREQPLLSADVERVAARVDADGHDARVADVLVDGCGGEHSEPIFGVARSAAAVVDHLHQPDAGLAGAEHGFRVGERARAKQVDDQVVLQLLVRARIVDERLRLALLFGVDEARTASTWP